MNRIVDQARHEKEKRSNPFEPIPSMQQPKMNNIRMSISRSIDNVVLVNSEFSESLLDPHDAMPSTPFAIHREYVSLSFIS